MSKIMYCWRAKKEVPMLDGMEWEVLYPRLIESIEDIQRHRSIHGSTIEQARAAGFGQAALDCYFQLTGYKETNPDFLWHYKASKYGPLCEHCGKPLRTPEAMLCAECGTSVPNPSLKRDAAKARRPLA
jgi:hypothetical protein